MSASRVNIGSGAKTVAAQPFYLDGSLGPLFCLHFSPPNNQPPRGSVLYIPPFAEEANRSRRMAVLQARRLSSRGWPVLMLDPYGTGDSGGDFRDARWETWLADGVEAARWLADRWPEAPLTIWGLRLGALLAAALSAQEPGLCERLLFWQPLLRGDRFLTQFLRLRVATGMADAEKETVQVLRDRMARGEVLEIAGYELAPDLANVIDGLRLKLFLGPRDAGSVDWLELSSTGGHPALSPGTLRLLGEIGDDGRPLARAIAGEPFWSIQEVTLVPNLLDATDALFD
jgi:exosortase A-associated hydrolase 2